MKIACVCPTYKRPRELAEAIESFLRQDYPAELRSLIVLDDVGQYSPDACDGLPGVRLVTTSTRYVTLGGKRNASVELAGDADAICVWDDDDIYLPWHVSACARAIAGVDYAIPTKVLSFRRGGKMIVRSNASLFHGAWIFTRAAFERVGGYPLMQSGQDQALLARFKAAHMHRGDHLLHDARPSYIYRWGTTPSGWHISALSKTNGYERLAARQAEHVAKIVPAWSRDWLAAAASPWRSPVGK